jgi:hypothetical protein
LTDLGITDDYERHAKVTRILYPTMEKPMESFKMLTFNLASAVIKALQNERDRLKK